VLPSPWVGIVLVLATHRCVRLVGWDHLSVLVRARAWITGEHATNSGSTNARMGLTSERVEIQVAHRRPFFYELFGCPYCMSVWIGTAAYIAWYFEPWWTMTILAPAALSSAVGIVSRWLDP
jgi:Protein of unknown function (DUF1360)